MDERDEGVAARDEVSSAELEAAESIGRALLSDPTHPAWSDPRFIEWLAVEAREGARRSWRVSAGERRMRGEAMMVRAQARRLGWRRGAVPPW